MASTFARARLLRLAVHLALLPPFAAASTSVAAHLRTPVAVRGLHRASVAASASATGGPWLAGDAGWEKEREPGALPADFALERFFAKYEFSARHLLCCSDVEPLKLSELLQIGEESAESGDALELWRGLSLGYTETRGHPALLAEIASSYNDDAAVQAATPAGSARASDAGLGEGTPRVDTRESQTLERYTIGAEHILECAPQEGVALALAALLQPEDTAVVVCPAYQSLAELALCRGARCYPWRARGGCGSGVGGSVGGSGEGDGAAGSGAEPLTFAVDDLEVTLRIIKLVTGRPATLIITNFPHNPSGATLSPSDWERVVRLAEEGGSWLLSDEMYRGLEGTAATAESPARAQPLAAAASAYARGISLSGMSKVYGLPGVRIGWLACPDTGLLARMGALRDFTTICSAAPSQILALIALRNRAALRQRARELVGAGAAAAGAFFEKHADRFVYHAPVAGPIAFPALRDPAARAADAEAYCEGLVREHGARTHLAAVCLELCYWFL